MSKKCKRNDYDDGYVEDTPENSTPHYFNTHEFTKALKIINSDPEGARKAFEKYIEKYPKDYWAQSVYASILITLKEFDLAEEVLNHVENKVFKDGHLANDFLRKHNDERSIFFSRIRLLSYKERYKELYDYLTTNPKFVETFNLKELLLYCKKKIGILKEERMPNYYLARQVIRYEEQDMLHHVRYQPNSNIFSVDFPLNTIINEVRKYIPSEKSLCPGVLADWYYFKFDECGKEDLKTTNYFKVVCFHNTSDIIIICPVKEGEKLPYVDLNYLKENKEQPKVKQKSQTQKFLDRYKKR